jgi:hypothetical protein
MTVPSADPAPQPTVREQALFAGSSLAILLLFYAVALPCGQALMYLRYGSWPSLPALYLFERPDSVASFIAARRVEEEDAHRQTTREEDLLTEYKGLRFILSWVPSLAALKPSWLSQPTSWTGLHKVVRGALQFCPFWLVPFGLGLATIFGLLAIPEHRAV